MSRNALVTRFPNGVGTRGAAHPFADLPTPDPTKVHSFFTDFDTFLPSEWTVTKTQVGATQATIPGDGGLLQLVNTAANNDLNQIQKVPAAFVATPGKRLFFGARLQVSDNLLTGFVVGLQNANIDGLNPALATQGMFFTKAAGTAVLSAFVRKDNAAGSVTAPLPNLIPSATMINVWLAYDGVDRVEFGYGTSVVAALPASALFLPTANLAPIFGIKNGDAVARTATIDLMFSAKER